MTNILTLRLDPEAQEHFDALRERYFPPERNHIAAHLTLFHALPDAAEVQDEIASAAREQRSFLVEVAGVRSLGKGVAYRLASPALLAVHARLARSFAADLIPQDRQRLQPHIVVQNKVTPEQARALLARLSAEFVPTTVTALGFDLWHYLGGPWAHAATFLFRS